MEIIPVLTKSDLHSFIKMPYQHYKNDPVWVPPLKDEQWGQFLPERNPLLDHTEYALFLLKQNGQIIGRIAAHIDRLALDFWKDSTGFFGYYECIQNEEAAHLLLDTAYQWLKERGMTAMRGPWSFVSQEWGSVMEGFTPSPCVMAPYNPPWYNEQYTAFQLEKVKDLLCYSISAREGYQIPQRILTLTDAVKKRFGITIREVNMKRYEEEISNIIELSNQTLIHNWGYSPVTDAEARAMARDMKNIIQPKGVIFAQDSQGKLIGFAIVLPDINVLLRGLNGNLFPLGWLKLLWNIPRLNHYRMFALGVIPEYHGKGIDSLLYRALYEKLYSPDFFMEINYVLEDNAPMNNAIKKLGAKPFRRYRIYEKNIE